jgi:hypothetical protein
VQFKFALFGALIVAAVLAAPTRDDLNPDTVVEEDIVPDTVESFTDLVQRKAKTPLVLQALACMACDGKTRCAGRKLRSAKCTELSGFSLTRTEESIADYTSALARKDRSKVKKASTAFKKSLRRIDSCNITPKGLKTCIVRGLKIPKKTKKSAKKPKKSAKKPKKSAKKPKKSAKKSRKSAKGGRNGRCGGTVGKVVATLNGLLKLC